MEIASRAIGASLGEEDWGDRINVGQLERLTSIMGGTLVSIFSLGRRPIYRVSLAVLGAGLFYRGITGRCRIYSALGIRTAGQAKDYKRGIRASAEITVRRPVDELYRFWRNLENLPKIMRHIMSVRVDDELHSHWIAKGPARMKLEWDAEIINDFENELITWQSLENADVINAGSVSFRPSPNGEGSIVKVVLRYAPPGGRAGAAVAKLFGDDPSERIMSELRKFNEAMGPIAEPNEQWHLAEFKDLEFFKDR